MSRLSERAPATDKESGLPKKYFSKKQSDSTKDKRASHFKKGAKLSDDDPRAYEPAPGDASAKTKPSKYTKKYDKMFGEELSTLPTGRFGLSRREMPQIKSTDVESYLDFMRDRGVGVRTMSVPVSSLTNTQKELDTEKISTLVTTKKSSVLAKPVIVSKDMFILDGHHRLNALFNLDPSYKVKVHKVNLSIKELIDMTKRYPKVSYKKLTETMQNVQESKKAVQNKAKETGVPYKILKQVYDRGIAAWRTGHRPGTTPHQWGLARINSFVTGGKTSKTADKDLYAKAKKYLKEGEHSLQERRKSAVSQGKVEKFITGLNIKLKGKRYDEVEFELVKIDNQSQTVVLNVLSPKELFGHQLGLTFKQLRRGPFFKTDTSSTFSEQERQTFPIPEIGSEVTAVDFRERTPFQPTDILTYKEFLKLQDALDK